MNRPWMPLYVADYRKDTGHLSAAEHGAYLLLIMHYWATGGLPDGDGPLSRIACMSPSEWKRSKATIQAFFHDGWRHKRVDEELAHAAEVSSKRRASAEQRHSKSSANAHAIADANAEQLETHARASSQSQSPSHEEKEDTADAVPPPSNRTASYAFESGVIRLSEKDFNQWQQAFSHLDLRAELLALTEWAGQQPKWFFAVSAALAKRNREAKAAAQRAANKPEFDWKDCIV